MKKIIFTIDTEIGEIGRKVRDPFATFVEGKVGGKKAGYELIMAILDQFDAKGEFFVDIYPYKVVGEDKYSQLCKNIVKRGHLVQLHTHPSFLYDSGKPFMHQYPLKKQEEIISHGISKILEWTGSKPIAHRAGGYGINADTLKALESSGIKYDSSYYFGHKNCLFKDKKINSIFTNEGVTVVPVTSYKKTNNLCFTGLTVVSNSSLVKLDYRYGSSVSEISEVIKKCTDGSVVIIFLHSFNFLRLLFDFKKNDYKKIDISDDLIKQFRELVKVISENKDCKFATFGSLEPDDGYCKDELVTVIRNENIFHYFGRLMDATKGAREI